MCRPRPMRKNVLESVMKKQVSRLTKDLQNLYFLVLVDGKIRVLHCWKVSCAIASPGQQLAGLIGDWHMMEGGNVTPPSIWIASGSQANQWKSFAKKVCVDLWFGSRKCDRNLSKMTSCNRNMLPRGNKQVHHRT